MENEAFFYGGSDPLNGIWIDLDDGKITDWDDVHDALVEAGIKNLDEIFVADATGLCRHFIYSHGGFDLEGCLECLESDIEDEVKEAYLECFDVWDAGRCEDSYEGEHDSWTAYAEDYAESTGLLDRVPEDLRYYFDFEAYGRDIRIAGDMREENGHFFRVY